jgi:AraC family transcriptional regulator of arabinose operon
MRTKGQLSFAASRIEARKLEPRIHRAISLMTADLRHEIEIDKLARALNLSVSRLHHLFKAETGLSPMRYLKAQRMQKAQELLETTFLNVKEVLLKVGVKDESHFLRDFKKKFGLSPSQYRIQYLKTEQKRIHDK